MDRWTLGSRTGSAASVAAVLALGGCADSHEIGAVFEPDDGVEQAVEALSCDPGGAPFGGGQGSMRSPYLLCTAAQLEAVVAAPGSSFALASDVTLEREWTPVDVFSGVLDGRGHVVTGLRIARSDEYRVAFIRSLDGALVRIAFDGVDVSGRTGAAIAYRVEDGARLYDVRVRGTVRASAGESAGVAAFVQHDAQASDVSFEGEVVNDGEGEAVGGVFAKVFGQASRVFARATVRSGGSSVGGLVGALSGGTLSECAGRADVQGALRIGGLVGIAGNATLVDCLSDGDVRGAAWVGGVFGELVTAVQGARAWTQSAIHAETANAGFAIVGNNGQAAELADVYWNRDTAGVSTPGFVVGVRALDADALRSESPFASWPASIWRIDRSGYPHLSRERETQCDEQVPFTSSGEPCEIPE